MLVAILGASSNPTRYAYRAAQRLTASGHRVFGVNPRLPVIDDVEMVSSIANLPPGIHSLTVYVSAPKSDGMADSIVGYGFERVIFNPGAENPTLADRLRAAGVRTVNGCTLVMLSTHQF